MFTDYLLLYSQCFSRYVLRPSSSGAFTELQNMCLISSMGSFNGISASKGRVSKFRVGPRVRQETPEEGRKTHRPKRCEYNNTNLRFQSRNNPNSRKYSDIILKQLTLPILYPFLYTAAIFSVSDWRVKGYVINIRIFFGGMELRMIKKLLNDITKLWI